MKFSYGTIVVLGMMCFSAPGQAQGAASNPSDRLLLSPDTTSAKADAPAQQRIDAAKRQILANPKKVQAFNDLATAYLRRARETADPQYLQDASQSLSQGLRLDAADFQLQKTQVAILLARHSFAEANQHATILNRRTPDDAMIYGYLAEAEIALGDYPAAEKNAQWMLNMRANNVPGLLLGARLRTVYGDPEGALELLNLAYSETSPTEVEDLAWIANEIATVQLDTGKTDAAVPVLQRAAQLFPQYPYTLENLARVRCAQGRPKDAIALLLQIKVLDSNPEMLYSLAAAQREAGQLTDASATDRAFEKSAAGSADQTDATNRDLILLYAGDPARTADALALAQSAMDGRHDVDTLDAYAWALYVNGRYREADAAMQRALAVGIQSAAMFDHAGHIARELARDADASKDFELSLQTNPSSVYAADARAALGSQAAVASQRQTGRPAAGPSLALEAGTAGSASAASGSKDSTSKPLQTHLALAPLSFSPVPAALLTPRPTDTQRLIHNAQAGVARDPKNAVAYATLGATYFQEARETGDVSDYQLAEKSLNLSLDLVSGDFSSEDALGSLAEVCMGEHRFSDALAYSQKALSLGSGDVSPFAIVGDAYADMGEYDKATAAYARLTPREMTLSPRAAYARDSRLSYLEFIRGDTAKAIDLMKIAVAEGVEAQLPQENLAWLYYELGEYLTQSGDALSANAAYLAALEVHPGDYRALAGLAKLRANNGRYAEAIVLYGKAIAVVPMPIFVGELGDLYAKTGNQAEAQKQYQLVQYIGLLGHINQVLHNRDLAIFYADHDMKLPEALQLAQKEFEVRHDIYTWDALAWALYKNGRFADAGKASEKALAHGTRDSLLLYHAGLIAEKLGSLDRAKIDLKEALQINPHFHLTYANVAQQRLNLLNTQTALNATPNTHAR